MSGEKRNNDSVAELSETLQNEQKLTTFHPYKKFKKLVNENGDYVVVSKPDTTESDTAGGCDIAKITEMVETLTLDENRSNNHPFRAKVHSKPARLPPSSNEAEPINTSSEEYFFIEKQSLPGREAQLHEILIFVRQNLLQGTSGCMYISGEPGTGKTMTVNTALKILKEQQEVPEFQLVTVNGMMIEKPRHVFVQIYKQLTGESVGWKEACTLLEELFANSEPRTKPTILFVEEIDTLRTRRGRKDVIYSILEWATHDTAQLTVLGLGIPVDLPERVLSSTAASIIGLTKLTFPPYSESQLQCIVALKVARANDLTPDALQLIAKIVAADYSGDARRAISLYERACEMAAPNRVEVKHVNLAYKESNPSGKTSVIPSAAMAIQYCSPAEKLMLRAMVAEMERTGSDETTLTCALQAAGTIVALDGRTYGSAEEIRPPTYSQGQAICANLSAYKLIRMTPKRFDVKLLLNCSVDDVNEAIKS